MALGDGDIAIGIFFGDFGDTILFGAQGAKGNVDGAAKDAMFGHLTASDTEYRAETSATAFNPMPGVGSQLTISTGRYQGRYAVRSVDPLDDGATVEIKLRAL